MPASADLETSLAAVCASALRDEGVKVEALERLSGGASRETWSFDARRSDGSVVPLILRRDPPGAARGGMGLEARLIQAAAAVGVPVPHLYASDDDQASLGAAFMVVQRIEGETIPRRVLRQPELAEARAGLARQCGSVLAALHSIPPDTVPGLASEDQVARYRQVLDAMDQPVPTFEAAFRWLEENRPVSSGEAIVHGDFRNGNLLVGPDGLRAVLDWELAHRGDPVEDLGWLCAKCWRFGVDLPVGGFGTYEDLLAGYSAGGGKPVDPATLRWWEVLANLKWGVMCMMQAAAHTSGAIRSVELAAIGRRVCEVEWDLLQLLVDPAALAPDDAWPAAPGPGRPDELHGSPSAAVLVEAVREFLEGDVMSATSGRVRFHARVAANVLGMIEREIAMGPEQASLYRQRLDAAGVGSTGELAAAIRSGRLDWKDPRVTRLLVDMARARLSVANPRYLEAPAPPAS
ncbi:MAG TPA: phosphotransferase family protein [Acidimicrobiales bacterium]|nr:phosphotransferase family protein [Acidimicrobiales bacterium]